MIPKLIDIKSKPNYFLWLKFSDGVEGEIDFSGDVRKGVFAYWKNPKNFENVRIGSSGEISWNEEVDICADSMYLKITGKKAGDIFPALAKEQMNA